MWVYSHVGVADLPHNAEAQREIFHQIPQSAARPGDLIFYLDGNYAITWRSTPATACSTQRGSGQNVKLEPIWSSDITFGTDCTDCSYPPDSAPSRPLASSGAIPDPSAPSSRPRRGRRALRASAHRVLGSVCCGRVPLLGASDAGGDCLLVEATGAIGRAHERSAHHPAKPICSLLAQLDELLGLDQRSTGVPRDGRRYW